MASVWNSSARSRRGRCARRRRRRRRVGAPRSAVKEVGSGEVGRAAQAEQVRGRCQHRARVGDLGRGARARALCGKLLDVLAELRAPPHRWRSRFMGAVRGGLLPGVGPRGARPCAPSAPSARGGTERRGRGAAGVAGAGRHFRRAAFLDLHSFRGAPRRSLSPTTWRSSAPTAPDARAPRPHHRHWTRSALAAAAAVDRAGAAVGQRWRARGRRPRR